jgi:hydroxymethylglutaryl-CoA lyase
MTDQVPPLVDFGGERVRIVEVGPRDGLQNHSRTFPTETKLELVARLFRAGLQDVEVTSFVRPDRVPQLADADELLPRAVGLGPRAIALVANRRGLERAMAAGAQAVSLIAAASEGFSKANTGRSVAKGVAELRELAGEARAAGLWVRGYVSTCFRCPYDGPVAPAQAVRVLDEVAGGEVDEVVVSDTLGDADPAQVAAVCEPMLRSVGAERLALHLHDTRELAVANLLVALQLGMRSFDGSVGGLGGCPFAPGARGNVATEKVASLCERLGLVTGVDLEKLAEAKEVLDDEHVTRERQDGRTGPRGGAVAQLPH